MNKAELIDKIAEDAEINKKQATAALDSFTDSDCQDA
jgi:nucleoid DNA-binding protein